MRFVFLRGARAARFIHPDHQRAFVTHDACACTVQCTSSKVLNVAARPYHGPIPCRHRRMASSSHRHMPYMSSRHPETSLAASVTVPMVPTTPQWSDTCQHGGLDATLLRPHRRGVVRRERGRARAAHRGPAGSGHVRTRRRSNAPHAPAQPLLSRARLPRRF